VSTADPSRSRFAATAELQARRADERHAALERRLLRFAELHGTEHALDVGTGAGAVALALAPHVNDVVGVEVVPELIEAARRRGSGVANVSFVEADATELPFELGSFDLVSCSRLLHHVPRPELVVAELARVTSLGGRLLVIDQIAPADPLLAIELDRFERERDPSHTRLLPDTDLRSSFDANRLVLVRSEFEQEQRAIDDYLDLAGCEGEARERARALAPGRAYTADLGWYLLRRA
jgi:ubiquinone/menaquinone biosynthesis C-methylase UbiE